MNLYIGSALAYPIKGKRVGMKLRIDADDLATALNHLKETSNQDFNQLEIAILPLKPENVDGSRTHSVKLIKLIK